VSSVLAVSKKRASVIFPSQNHTTIMPSSSRGGTGRIRSHQRPTDNSVPILGENLSDKGEDYENALHDTVRRGMDDKCHKDCRRRQQRIAEFWKKNCPHCYEVGVQEVSAEDLNDRTKFYFQPYKFDLKYSGINVDCVLHFLMQNDTKANGKLKSFQDTRKHRDAMLWGAKVADKRMPQTFYEKTDICLEACKKKFVHERKAGSVDEHATDPIPMPVCELLLKWSIVETSNVFAWFWTISQWNFMARSIQFNTMIT
jgi:hypothetical protein